MGLSLSRFSYNRFLTLLLQVSLKDLKGQVKKLRSIDPLSLPLNLWLWAGAKRQVLRLYLNKTYKVTLQLFEDLIGLDCLSNHHLQTVHSTKKT